MKVPSNLVPINSICKYQLNHTIFYCMSISQLEIVTLNPCACIQKNVTMDIPKLFTTSPIDVMKLSFYEFTHVHRYFTKINNCTQVDKYTFDTNRDTVLHM